MSEYVTWNGLQAINTRCHGCIYSYVKHGTLICGKTSRTVANNLGVQECASYVKRDAQPGRLLCVKREENLF